MIPEQIAKIVDVSKVELTVNTTVLVLNKLSSTSLSKIISSLNSPVASKSVETPITLFGVNVKVFALELVIEASNVTIIFELKVFVVELVIEASNEIGRASCRERV